MGELNIFHSYTAALSSYTCDIVLYTLAVVVHRGLLVSHTGTVVVHDMLCTRPMSYVTQHVSCVLCERIFF